MRFVRTWGLLALCGATTGSCTTDACGCPPAAVTAAIHGTVTDHTGLPVARASVQAYSAPKAGCHSTGLDFGGVLTDEDGRYQMGLAQLMPQDSVCVFAFARPPQGVTALTGSDTLLVALDFRFDVPYDDAHVALTLHPR